MRLPALGALLAFMKLCPFLLGVSGSLSASAAGICLRAIHVEMHVGTQTKALQSSCAHLPSSVLHAFWETDSFFMLALLANGCTTPAVQNGRLTEIKPAYSPRDYVTVECDPGYTLSSLRKAQCQVGGTWDPPVPACERGKST